MYRSVFYTAQSYMDSKYYKEAIQWYTLFTKLKNTWDEEFFESNLRIALCMMGLGFDEEKIKTASKDIVEIRSKKSTLDRAKHILYLYDAIELTQLDNHLNCELAIYYHLDNKFICEKNVRSQIIDPKTFDKITTTGNIVILNTKTKDSQFKGEIKGTINRKRVYDPPINFSANQLDYVSNDAQIHLEENVEITRQDFNIRSKRATMQLDNYGNKKLNYYVFENNVVLRQKLPNQINRTAYGEKLEGFLPENYVILTGAPRVEQGKDVTRGNRIILYENTSMMEIEDAVTSVIYDPNKWNKKNDNNSGKAPTSKK
jgi:lipopolysaccharide transport protein LptA